VDLVVERTAQGRHERLSVGRLGGRDLLEALSREVSLSALSAGSDELVEQPLADDIRVVRARSAGSCCDERIDRLALRSAAAGERERNTEDDRTREPLHG
jgi:hypothetical protein